MLINRDHYLHMIVSFFLCVCAWVVFDDVGISLLVTMIIGIGKEVKDEIVYGGFDWSDILFDAIGCIFFIGAYTIASLLLGIGKA